MPEVKEEQKSSRNSAGNASARVREVSAPGSLRPSEDLTWTRVASERAKETQAKGVAPAPLRPLD